MNEADLRTAAAAQLDSSVCFFLVTVDDAGVLKFVVLEGTPLEEAGLASQARAFAELVVGVQAQGVAAALTA